jgi:hypothetical protein
MTSTTTAATTTSTTTQNMRRGPLGTADGPPLSDWKISGIRGPCSPPSDCCRPIHPISVSLCCSKRRPGVERSTTCTYGIFFFFSRVLVGRDIWHYRRSDAFARTARGQNAGYSSGLDGSSGNSGSQDWPILGMCLLGMRLRLKFASRAFTCKN